MVKVTDRYVVRADGSCYSACEVGTRPLDAKDGKGGKTYYRPIGYGGSLTEALTVIRKRLQRDAVAGDGF